MNPTQASKLKYKKLSVCVLMFLCTSNFIFAQIIEITVTDCETKEPISDVQIYTEAQKFLGTTNKEGQARLQNIDNDKINFKKLGYDPLLLTATQLHDICLYKKSQELSEVVINYKKANFYDTLITLRNKNKTDFLNYEGILTYSFIYKTTSLNNNTVIDEGKGYFTVRYQKDYAYPNLFSNTNDYAKVIDFHYDYDPKIAPNIFESIKYLDPSTLICCYDVMEKKFGTPDWWNYNNLENGISTKSFKEPDGGRKFVTYRKNDEVSRNFYFDKDDKIQKVEILKPTYFFGSNYDKGDSKFFVSIAYSKTLPRVANKYVHSYEFISENIAYHTTLSIEQCFPKEQTLIIPDNQKKNTVFSLIGSFHDLTKEIEEAKLKMKK